MNKNYLRFYSCLFWNQVTFLCQAALSFLTTHAHSALWLMLIGVVIIIFLSARQRYRAQQRLALERMRARIAMDLHDDIGANLSRIAMLSEVLQQDLENPELPARLARIASISRESVDSLSDIVWAINPTQDRLVDLTQRMRRLADDLCAARDLEFSFHADVTEQGCKLITETRRELLLIFKECINNIAKHSNCTAVDVIFQQRGDCLRLIIADNGKGIDLLAMQNGNGLGSMRQRARKLGGTLEIKSVNGFGTTISLQLPFLREKAF